jgi:hypothetical protein
VVVAGLGEPVTGALAHQPLGARACVQAAHLDADEPAGALAVRERLADQVVDLLRLQVGDRRAPGDRELGPDRHLGANRLLPLDDAGGDVLGQLLDVEGLADDDVVDALGHGLGEAGHVHALLTGVEVDEAVDLGVVEKLGARVRDPDHLVDAGDPGARQCEMDVGLCSLEVVREG